MTKEQVEGRIEETDADDTRSATSRSAPKTQEATVLWSRNHKVVIDLFDEYAKINITSRKKSLVSQICVDLTIHAQAKEEILFPAVNAILKDKRLVPQAILKHGTLKGLIAEVEGLEPDAEDFDAKVKVLSEYVKDHVKEEQEQMFPRVTATNLDMMELGARIASRKEELVVEHARRA